MATISNLNILLTMEDHATKVLKRAQRDFVGLGNSMKDWGTGFMAGVTLPIVVGTAAIVKAASDQQEAINAVSEVYGSASQAVIDNASAAATAMGLSKQEYLSSAAVLGVYADAAGLAGQDAVKFANDNLQLAADLGSFYNASTSDVQAALTAAYRGEFDALDRFGIMLNQATLEQYALSEGIWDGNGAMTHQQRILATNAYMQSRAGAAAGDFARTSNSLANSQKILRAQLKDLAAQLGQVLLPTVTRMVAVMRDLIARFQALPESWQRWIVIIGLAAAAIGPLLITLGTLLTVLPAIGAAFAILTGPIGLVIGAIALLTAAYIGNWWGFRDAVNAVAGAVENAVNWLWEIDAVRSTVTSAINAIKGAFDRVTGSIGKFGSALMSGDWRTAIAAIGDFLAAPAKAIGDFIKGITTGFAPLDSLLTNVGNMFTDFGRIIQEIFQGDFSGAIEVFERAIKRVPEIVTNVFDIIPWEKIKGVFLSGLRSLSDKITQIPGFDELTRTLTTIETTVNTVVGTIQDAATAISNVQIPIPPGLQALFDKVQDVINKVNEFLDLWNRLPVVGGGGGDSAEVDKAYDDVRTYSKRGGAGSTPARMVIPEPDLTTFNLAFTSGIPTTVDTAITEMASKVAGAVVPAPSTSSFDATAATLPRTIESAMRDALRIAESMARTIVSSVAGTLNQFAGIGRNAAYGLASGMLGGIVAVQSAALSLALAARRTVENALRVESPSRVFEDIGENLGKGLANGMRRSLPTVTTAANAMAAAASTGMGLDGATGAGGYWNQANYGTIINEAPRYPADAIDSYSISRSRG